MSPRAGPFGPVAALALGALATLGFAPVDHAEAAVAGLAGLLFLVRGAAPRRAFVLGWAYGLGFFIVGVSWVYVSMHDVGGMPAALAALAVFLFAAYLALFPAMATGLSAMTSGRQPAVALLTVPACWVFTEWLRGWLFTGFPWLALGYAGTGGPFAPFAPVLGVHGLGWLYAFAAAALVDMTLRAEGLSWHRLRARDIALPVLLAAGLLMSRFEWTRAEGPPVKVALLQGNVPQDLKFEEGRFDSTLATYRRLIESNPANITVLPETALPRMLHAVPREYLDTLQTRASAAGANLVIGVPRAESSERYFNSAVSLGADPPQRYDKVHLVPFGEFIPWGFRWFVDAMKMPLGDFTRGSAMPQPMRLGGQRIAINICYEDLFGEEIIRQLPEASLLVNISNIAWFGDSLAPHQHLQISRMRALETGRMMLRSTNTGMTAAIGPDGRVIRTLAPFTEGALVVEAQGRSGSTPYVRVGNWPVITVCVLILAVAWRRRARPDRAPA